MPKKIMAKKFDVKYTSKIKPTGNALPVKPAPGKMRTDTKIESGSTKDKGKSKKDK